MFTSILFSQTQVINSWEDWNFSGNSKPIPTIAANLKPERQPSWTDQSFINLVDELKIPSLRWPGAVGSNYFDWHKGTILPCAHMTNEYDSGWQNADIAVFGSVGSLGVGQKAV